MRLGVAIGAGEDGVIARIRMTSRAHAIRAAVIHVEPGVIERSSRPCNGGMAGRACCGKAGSRMVWICRAQILGLMTGKAVRRRPGEHIVDMATGTCHGHVRACKREWRVVVVENCPRPGHRCMAGVAGGGKTGGRMLGVGRGIEVFDMARITVGRQRREVVVHMTGGASQARVRPGKGERGFGMVERGWYPCHRGMADRAISRKSGRFVIRIRGGVIRAHVARRAVGRSSRKLTVDVALRALQGCVRTGEREFGEGGMVKRGVGPVDGRVTHATVAREARLDMIRIGSGHKFLLVAGVAICRRSLEFVVDMAGGAIESCMHAGQGKPGESGVIKLRAEPGVHGVARFACDGKPAGAVV